MSIGYKVYIRKDTGEAEVLVGSTDQTSLTIETGSNINEYPILPDQDYLIKVKSHNEYGTESDFSDEFTVHTAVDIVLPVNISFVCSDPVPGSTIASITEWVFSENISAWITSIVPHGANNPWAATFDKPLAGDSNWVSIQPTTVNVGSVGQWDIYSAVKDSAGNVSNSLYSFVIASVFVDIIPPTVPVLLSPVTSITEDSMTLTWVASTDNVGVAMYHVYRDGTYFDAVAHPTVTYTASGLTSGTTYAWQVRARDAAFNYSALSNTVNGTTATPPIFQRIDGNAAAWNISALGLPTHANSAALAAQMTMPQPGSNAINWNITGFDSTDYSYPVYYVADSNATYTVSCTDTSANWNNQTIPFNSAWLPANNGGDRQMIILDESNGREWCFYYVSSIDTTNHIIHCTRCNVVPNDVNGSMTGGIADCRGPNGKVKGCVKFRGVGIQYLSMLVRPEEVSQGVIEHALSMPIPNPSCNIYYNPCTKAENYNDGSISRCTPGVPSALTVISSLTHSGATATATVANTSGITNGGIIFIYGATDQLYNGVFNANVVNSTTFTYTMNGTPGSNASGTLRYQVGGIPEGARFRGTWTDTDIDTWLSAINSRIIGAGGSTATSTGIQKLARCMAIAMRDYGWIVSDHAGSHHLQCEMNVSANQSRGRVRWLDMDIPNNTVYGSKTYPRDLLDGLVSSSNVIAVDGTASYPSNTGTG